MSKKDSNPFDSFCVGCHSSGTYYKNYYDEKKGKLLLLCKKCGIGKYGCIICHKEERSRGGIGCFCAMILDEVLRKNPDAGADILNLFKKSQGLINDYYKTVLDRILK